jgi:hypothetical protein
VRVRVEYLRYNPVVTPIRITRHARNRMRRHGISEDLIRVTLQSSEWEEASVAGRTNRWRGVEARFLRVTCRDESERIVVISAVFRKKGPRGKEP